LTIFLYELGNLFYCCFTPHPSPEICPNPTLWHPQQQLETRKAATTTTSAKYQEILSYANH